MMNLPILSTVQQQLAAVFEQWLTMMREALARPVHSKSVAMSKQSKGKRPSLPDVERALRAKYHLRYNVLTGRTEYRAVDAADDVASTSRPRGSVSASWPTAYSSTWMSLTATRRASRAR